MYHRVGTLVRDLYLGLLNLYGEANGLLPRG